VKALLEMENKGNHASKRGGKTIEEIYQKKTQLEHILLRPDTYVGSIEHTYEEKWVFDEEANEMQFRKIDFVPALYKIFDEILVNAADHFIRDPKGMDMIEVGIVPEKNEISVFNNGCGIPVHMHKEHKVYVPEMLFGHLLTSDNYNDDEKKVVGGRNGFGAKLTNVFSTKFVLETVDTVSKKHYIQVFENNMSVIHPPVLKPSSNSKGFTKVTFYPDLARFDMRELDADIVALMTKRVFDIAGTTSEKCKVYLNKKRLGVNNFADYVRVYLKDEATVVQEVCSERWEVAFSISPQENFQQVSFVNSISTSKGGTHVQHVTDQLVDVLIKKVKAKNKGGMEIKPSMIKNHLWVFIKCLIENPVFDSQTKDTLTTKQNKFGSKCELSDSFISGMTKSGVIEQILLWVKAKEQVNLKKLKTGNSAGSRILGVPKLEDANEAGTKNGHLCTLILTEGDSAKALAVSGLSVVGRDHYGVFPLRGKVVNVRDASHKTVTENKEIQAMLKIVGLQPNKEYTSLNQLRYGSIMIMTDQDPDGSHIKGLLINFFQHWWPKLLEEHPGFLKEFITPLVKVWKEGKDKLTFYTTPEYQEWKEKHNNGKGWNSKYYKGLGTSTAKEAKEYFSNMEKSRVTFDWDEGATEQIDLAFRKTRADDRKEWMNAYEEGSYIDTTSQHVNYSDFINKELVLFSKYNVMRAIPSVVDGFKPTQRKIMFCCIKRKITKDVKVAQLGGIISQKAAYHHGEVSLENAMVNMAQNFVGSNNLNLLFPSGQFGTRIQGGSDSASARYIYTRMCEYTRHVFNEKDDHILTYLNEEGQWIEPEWYCPIIPMVLVNGADGIGTGWSTHVPNYSPMEIIANLRRCLRNEPMTTMRPWYRNFKGSILPSDKEIGKYDVYGIINKKGETSLEITELPIKKWTQDFKEGLQDLMPNAPPKKDDKGKVKPQGDPLIEDYREYHTENTVHFILKLNEQQMSKVEAEGLEKSFKIKSSLAETNMVLFDPQGKIRKYESANEIMEEFVSIRLLYYDKRKDYLIDSLKREKLILDERVRFILLVINNRMEIRNRKKADVIRDLEERKFKPWSEIQKNKKGTMPAEGNSKDDADEDGDDDEDAPSSDKKKTSNSRGDYDYLLGMPMWNLTMEKVEEMKKLLQKKAEELDTLIATSIEAMWDRDLQALQDSIYKAWSKELDEELNTIEATIGKKKKDGGKGPGKGGGRGGGASGSKDKSDNFGIEAPNLKEILSERGVPKFEEFTSDVGVVRMHDRPKPIPPSDMPTIVKPEGGKRGRKRAGAAAKDESEKKEESSMLDIEGDPRNGLEDIEDSDEMPLDGGRHASGAPENKTEAESAKPGKGKGKGRKKKEPKDEGGEPVSAGTASAKSGRRAKGPSSTEPPARQRENSIQPPPPKPVSKIEDNSSAGLLQRLLARQKERKATAMAMDLTGPPAKSSHTALSGSAEFFGYLHGSNSNSFTQPFDFLNNESLDLDMPSASGAAPTAASSSGSNNNVSVVTNRRQKVANRGENSGEKGGDDRKRQKLDPEAGRQNSPKSPAVRAGPLIMDLETPKSGLRRKSEGSAISIRSGKDKKPGDGRNRKRIQVLDDSD